MKLPQRDAFRAMHVTQVLQLSCIWNGYETVLLCPVCQCHNSHLGDTNTESDSHSDLCTVDVDGECGHSWQLCVEYSKGNTVIFARALKEEFDKPAYGGG